MGRRLLFVFTLALAGTLVLSACGGDDDPVAGDPAAILADDEGARNAGDVDASEPLTTTTQSPAAAEAASTTTEAASKLDDDAAVEVVLAALDAKNSFDIDSWLMAFEGGTRGYPLFADELLASTNQQWKMVEPCQVTGETSSGETVVECVLKDITDFWGVGGISDTKAQRFTVNADGLLTSKKNSFSSNRRDSFNAAFHKWLRDAHPDVYKEMDPGVIDGSAPGWHTKNLEHMLVAVAYVEEFVAQSDVYPLDPTNP